MITACSQCQRTSSLDAFFNDVLKSPHVKLAVIGCGCSVATEPVAEISHRWNISQVYISLIFEIKAHIHIHIEMHRVYPYKHRTWGRAWQAVPEDLKTVWALYVYSTQKLQELYRQKCNYTSNLHADAVSPNSQLSCTLLLYKERHSQQTLFTLPSNLATDNFSELSQSFSTGGKGSM